MRIRFLTKAILPFLIISIFIFSLNSCSDDDDPNPDPVNGSAKIKIIADKTVVEPFEDIKVTIDVDYELLSNNYDSLTWQSNGAAYGWFSNHWTGDSELDIRIADYKLGKYKVYSLGYKDGIVISKDSIEYEVIAPRGDFFSFRWGVETKNQDLHYKTGITPNHFLPTYPGWTKIGGVTLNLSYFVENVDAEYAMLQFIPWTSSSNMYKTQASTTPNINDFDWNDQSDEGYDARCEMEQAFLHAYITELYGESILRFEGQYVYETDLIEDYYRRFKHVIEKDYYPIEIWETPTAFICLLRGSTYPYSGNHPNQLSLVVAEPRKY